ncbi:MAG: PorT family protein [Flavobacteriaceae bacterium]|nr:PorT family protein [Flavobacteriaceae bacterium]
MKKAILTLAIISSSLMAMAQNTQYGLQGGLNYNFSGDLNELQTVGDNIIHGAQSSIGYHGGLWLKMNYTDIFLKGEVLYTQYKTEFENDEAMTTKKIDVPIVVGMKILGPVYVFAGPDFQYVLAEDFSLDNTDVEFDDFTLGLHLGAGVEFGKVSFDVRWDKGLSGSDSEIVNSEFVAENFTLDNRPNQIVFSLNIDLSKKK